MSTLEEQLKNALNETVEKHSMYIDMLSYKRKGKEFILEIYVEREDMSSIDLDAIVALSEDISAKLDEIDLIKDNYCLDVSTSGTEKPINDFSKFPLLVGKYMELRLINPIKGQNIFVGTLESVEDGVLTISYREKTRTLNVKVDINNINKAKLTAKI